MMVQRAYMQVYEVNGKYTVDISASETGKVSLFLASRKTPEFKLNGVRVERDLLDCFGDIHNIIKTNYELMKKNYRQHPFIINKEIDVDQGADSNIVRQTFIPCYVCQLDNGYYIEVLEKQHGEDLIVSRSYYICDGEGRYKYLIHSVLAPLSDIEPLEKAIEENKSVWIKKFESEVINAVRKELQNIKEDIEEIVFGNRVFRSFSYNDGSYCIQTRENDEMSFSKYASYSDMNHAMADLVDKELGNSDFGGSAQTQIRQHLNNGRRFLADGKEMLFVSEMGTIKGVLLSASKNGGTGTTLQQIKLQEKGFDSFMERYKFITGVDML